MRSEREKVALAVGGSVLLHGIALILFALIATLRPPAPLPEVPEDDPVKLEVVEEPPDTPPPEPEPEVAPAPTPRSRLVVDATGEDSTDTPTPDAALSDRTTHASSAEASDASKPGATQAGRRMATFQFDPRPPAPGLVDRATPAPATAPEPPRPDRFARQPPANTPPPAATATPAPATAPDAFAMAMATPAPTPEDPFDPSIRSTSPPLPKPAARATPTPPVGTVRSAENGAGAVRGAGGVDTLATPTGRYAHQITAIIKFVWSRSNDSRPDLTYGATMIHCTIDKDGLVIAPRIVSNSSDPMSGATALQAVVVARLPPMPPEVVAELGGKRLPMDITFDLLPDSREATRR